jgi:hypothetical protein
VSWKGLLHGVRTYLGKVLFYSVWTYRTQEGYFVQCVDYFRRAFWRDWAYPAVYRIYTVYGMDLPRMGILYSALTHLGGHFVQCMGLSTKCILYSVLPYLGGYFVQCLVLSGRVLYSVIHCDLPGSLFCTMYGPT